MTGHLSSFQLDALVTEDPGSGGSHAAWRSHVEACASCRVALDARRAESAAFVAEPRVQGFREPPVPRRVRRSRWPALAAVGVLAAASVVLLVRTDPEVRAKGEVVTRFVSASGALVSRAKVGDHVSLQGVPTGAASVVVFARSGAGWNAFGPVAPDAAGRFFEFRVTPGDVEAVVVFLRPGAPAGDPGPTPDPARFHAPGELSRVTVSLGVDP